VGIPDDGGVVQHGEFAAGVTMCFRSQPRDVELDRALNDTDEPRHVSGRRRHVVGSHDQRRRISTYIHTHRTRSRFFQKAHSTELKPLHKGRTKKKRAFSTPVLDFQSRSVPPFLSDSPVCLTDGQTDTQTCDAGQSPPPCWYIARRVH